LLWFDAVGASQYGIATLPRWLERLSAGEFDAAAEGKVMTERNGTAVLDGQNGLPPLVLERAAAIAAEKAREAGIGLVRVTPLGPMGPTAGIAAELAIGPFLAALVGPGPSWSLAFSSSEGLPAVFDSALAGSREAESRLKPPRWAGALSTWAEVVAPRGGWLVAALTIAAWESLPSFHERVKYALDDRATYPELLRPDACAAHRRTVREQGVPLPKTVWNELTRWAGRVGVAPLGPDLY
jgi:LDH2 family malate/lactate/ureidoglycolate dehydrogenase